MKGKTDIPAEMERMKRRTDRALTLSLAAAVTLGVGGVIVLNIVF